MIIDLSPSEERHGFRDLYPFERVDAYWKVESLKHDTTVKGQAKTKSKAKDQGTRPAHTLANFFHYFSAGAYLYYLEVRQKLTTLQEWGLYIKSE